MNTVSTRREGARKNKAVRCCLRVNFERLILDGAELFRVSSDTITKHHLIVQPVLDRLDHLVVTAEVQIEVFG